jgi:PAS domain S-box-containing protein
VKPKHLAQLRKEAEALATPTTGGPVELADVDRARLVHELQTHQIELELQNDQLREAQLELVQSHNLFSDLYNFAPIGYITLDRGLQIARANLRASELLGVDRCELVGSWFRRFVSSKDQDTYYHNIQKQPEFVTPQELELRLLKSDGTTFHARLEITASRESEGEQAHCLIAISDLSAQKKPNRTDSS